MKKGSKFKQVQALILCMILMLNLSLVVNADEEVNDYWEDCSVAVSFNYRDIAMNDDAQYIIVGNDGKILYSEDLDEWTSVVSPTKKTLFGCAYGSNRFVAVGSNGTIISSDNGKEWKLVNENSEILFDDVVYGRNGFVAVGSEPNLTSIDDKRYIWYSEDGVDWKQVFYYEGSFEWRKVSYLNGQYVAHNNYDGDIAYSKDGLSWKVAESAIPTSSSSIIWDGNKYVSAGNKLVESESEGLISIPYIYKSSNLLTWTEIEIDLSDDSYVHELVSYRGSYIMLKVKNDRTKLIISDDLKSWNLFIDREFDSMNSILVNFKKMVVVGVDGSIINVDTDRWRYKSNYNSDITKVVFNGTSYLATGHTGRFYSSTDGQSWNEYDSEIDFLVRDCIWADGKYYALRRVIDDKTDDYKYVEIYESSDAKEWSKISSIDSANIQQIRYCNDGFMVFGQQGEIYSSKDVISWERLDTSSDVWLNDLDYFNGKYYAVGMFGTLLTSVDGQNWSYQKMGNGNDLNAIATNGHSLMIVGDFMESYYTEDGLDWTSKQPFISENYDEVLWDGNSYVIFSYAGEYYKTTNGIDFISYSTDMYGDVETVAWDGYRYIVAGRDGCLSTCVPSDFIKIVINDKPVMFDIAPQIINDRTMIPARAVFEKNGAKVSWDNETKSVLVDKGDKSIVITIGSEKAIINGEEKTLDSPAVIIGGRTLVPVRFISEQLGMSIEWDNDTKTVIIKN